MTKFTLLYKKSGLKSYQNVLKYKEASALKWLKSIQSGIFQVGAQSVQICTKINQYQPKY